MQNNSPHASHGMGKTMIWIAWILALGMLSLGFYEWQQDQYNPNQSPLSSRGQHGEISVTLQRNRANHYVGSGTINGEAVIFLLDTGATDVVISQDLADELGLHRGYPSQARTANGIVTVYSTSLEELQLGELRFQQIRASINPAMHGREVLLGMSALKHVTFQQQGDLLTLTQK